tara:strand:- start:255 stop:674 length:420 start_codon:yes stop_codon:yes gene_type:complete
MLIICSSCNSKYLVNSADLKPNGRKVQCVRCSHKWFQTSDIDNQDIDSVSTLSTTNVSDDKDNLKNINLPSTIVKKQKISFINSFMVVLFTFALIFIYFLFKTNGINFFVFIKYYFFEFYFNLKMIIDDLAKIVFEILN